MALGEGGPRVGDPAFDRPGGRARLRMQDANGDRSTDHGLESSRRHRRSRDRPSSPRLHRSRSERRRRRAPPWPPRSGPRRPCRASRLRGVSRLYATDPSASPTSPSSATRSSPSTCRPARTRRPARSRCSPQLKDLERDVRTPSARSLGTARARSRPARLRAGAARHRTPARGPSLDADIDPRAAAKLLVVPHPAAGERLFVLAPLADLAPRARAARLGPRPSRRRDAGRLAVEGPDAVRADRQRGTPSRRALATGFSPGSGSAARVSIALAAGPRIDAIAARARAARRRPRPARVPRKTSAAPSSAA